ncbi:MAG TPA: exodeoxyribonuclease V subunit alpha [Rhodoferax sp.]|nr:exodeoxyribonuclease V subunit alpha [Rhodoferax sp.]
MSALLPDADTLELTGLDRALVAFLQAVQPSADPLHGELAVRVSQQFGLGHACLDLSTLAPELRQSAASLPWIDGPNSPLVLDGTRLYLRRNWQAEQSIRTSIAARLAQPCPAPANLTETLSQLFEPGQSAAAPDWQKVACALAARKRFTLITGGPGTGKTTTVVRLLALLQADPAREHTPLRIALAAPTGKAAARLGESIASAVQKLPEQLRQHIPTQAVTLHKLLQVRSNLAQDAVPELAVDLVVVDEASMIDLDMMARLLDAVPLSASLILLGDKDQLASVEAGAVMGQLCAGADLGRYTPDTLAWLAQTTGADLGAWAGDGSALAQQTVMLRLSHRFADDSGIGQWARAVNAGDSAGVATLWRQAPDWRRDASTSVTRLQPGQAHDPRLKALVQQGWQAWLQQLAPLKNSACSDAQALAALTAFASFQVLCAVRDGPWGVDSLNQRIAGSLGLPGEGWYAGRPVMVTRNDYNLKLMNGDVGLCLNHAKGLRVAFPDGQGGMRWVLPARLDAVETVFAMTVHKSQGSEFDHVALVLPDRPVAVLTRELLYTGMTRAKTRLTLVVPQAQVLSHAVGTRVLRSGGLTDL